MLIAIGQELRRGAPPVVARSGSLTALFGANLGIADLHGELARVAGAALALYEDDSEPEWKKTPPLVILVAHDGVEWHFRLDDASLKRVVDAGGGAANVNIRHEVADDFRREHGRL